MNRPVRCTALASAILLAMIAPTLGAQQLITVDLAKPTTDTIKVGAGAIGMRLTNALPSAVYTIRGAVVSEKEPDLVVLGQPGSAVKVDTVVTVRTDTVKTVGQVPVVPSACAVGDSMQVYLPIRREADIAASREALNRAMSLDAAMNRDCSVEIRRDAMRATRDGTYQTTATGLVQVKPGQLVVATVYRGNDAIASVLLESTVTPRRAFISYGVQYPFGNPLRRFALGEPDSAGRRPVRRAGSDEADPAVLLAVNIPTKWSRVFVTGFLPTAIGDGTVVGWGGGLTASVADQFMLHIGAIVGSQRRLRPEYRDVSASVTENLTEDQLTEMKHAPRFSVGISLRLASNPFGSGAK
jgi:hypothetical protein